MNLKFKYYIRLAILIVCINLKFCACTCDQLFTKFEHEVSISIFLLMNMKLNSIIGSMMIDVVYDARLLLKTMNHDLWDYRWFVYYWFRSIIYGSYSYLFGWVLQYHDAILCISVNNFMELLNTYFHYMILIIIVLPRAMNRRICVFWYITWYGYRCGYSNHTM